MHPSILALLWAISAFFIYKVAAAIIKNRNHAAIARRLGCQPAPYRASKYPFGIDSILRALQADRDKLFMDMLSDIFHELGDPPTFSQSIAGSVTFMTMDPKNIQAILATQFNDFELGSVRRGALWPMFGNGIFTADGKGWFVPISPRRPDIYDGCLTMLVGSTPER